VSEETLAGTVRQEVFRSATGFSVLRVSARGRGVVTVTGPLPQAHAGETLEAAGEWVDDPRYGRQFRARRASVSAPSGRDAVERFLASGAVAGIGKEIAKRIVARFGDETVRVLAEDPERLREVSGIGRVKLATIRESWEAQRATRETMLLLRGHGVGPVIAERIQAAFGVDTGRVLDEDPYRIARDVDGVGFLTADRLARALGLAASDPRRLRGGLLHTAREALDQGHTAVPRAELLDRAAAALGPGAAPGELEDALLTARQAGELELDAPAGEDVVYLPAILRAERQAALRAAELAAAPAQARPLAEVEPEEALAWVAGQAGVELSPDQALAVRAVLAAPVVVITGGPGVGKTTVVRALVHLFRRHRLRFGLAAPTGRAAKRLEEATGAKAQTLHRLLEWDPRQAVFTRDASDPLDLDALVVDETSMVDVRLFQALVRALTVGATLVLVGDVDQLPSVGPGAVLADLIGSGAARVVRLTEVFRQVARSRIVASAHAVNQGLVPDLSAAPAAETDFFFVAKEDPAAARDAIVRLVVERIPQRFGLDPFADVQVLAPMRKGVCGTEALNRTLRAALNCEAPADDGGPLRPAPGDKVMQLRNDYDHDVYNGDVGRVVGRDPHDGGLVVAFDGREVAYARGKTAQLALSYCATIHKSQGSEYPAVVLPVLTEHWIMLQRNLLYTGLTRARRLVVLVGQRRAVETAVKNDRPAQRVTYLGTRIERALAGRGRP